MLARVPSVGRSLPQGKIRSSPPLAAYSHSSAVGSRPPIQVQNCVASSKLRQLAGGGAWAGVGGAGRRRGGGGRGGWGARGGGPGGRGARVPAAAAVGGGGGRAGRAVRRGGRPPGGVLVLRGVPCGAVVASHS